MAFVPANLAIIFSRAWISGIWINCSRSAILEHAQIALTLSQFYCPSGAGSRPGLYNFGISRSAD